MCQRDVCGGPSGQPCQAVVPVKCCQRGCCGPPWRLRACCTALPAPGSRPQKRKFGSLKWRGCSRAISEPSTGPAPPTIFHMRTSVCVCVWGACVVCECWGGGELRADWGCSGACVREGTCFYEEMQAFKLISAGTCVVCPGTQIHTYKMVY